METITVQSAEFDTLAAANPTWPMVWISMSGGADRLAIIGTASTAYHLWLIGQAQVDAWAATYDARASQVSDREAARAALAMSSVASLAFPSYSGALTIYGLRAQASGAPGSSTSMSHTLTESGHIQGGELSLSDAVDGDTVTIEIEDDQGAVLHTLADALPWMWYVQCWTLDRVFPSVAQVMAGHAVRFTLTRGPGSSATCEMIAHLDIYA